MSTTRRVFILLAAGVAASVTLAAQIPADAFQGTALEQFLAKAGVKAMKDVGDGVTKPKKATIELNGITHFAIFKTIDVNGPGIVPVALGGDAPDFQDSWKTEVAAYIVDRIIGLDLVPATVERVIDKKPGSLQWWVDGTITDAARQQQHVNFPDQEAWDRAVLKMYLFDSLICNTDRNPSNMLVTTKDLRLRLIDHSRAFRAVRELRNPGRLTRFSRALLEGLTRLNVADLTRRAGRYLSDAQITAVVERRDALLALANRLIAERGEAAVTYQ